MRTRELTLTVTANTASSSAQLIADVAIGAIQFPTAWTGTGYVTIQAVMIGDQSGAQPLPVESDWIDMVDENGDAITVIVRVNKIVVLQDLSLAAMQSAHWVRLVPSVTQTSGRTIKIIGVQGK